MATVTIAQICDAVESTLGAATGITTSQSYNELTESINKPDLPLIQVYPENNTGTDATGNTDRSSFRGGVRQKIYTIHVDLYAAPRSKIDEDMSTYTTAISALDEKMEEQNVKPYFGLSDIKAFSWSWSRVTLEYAGTLYVGARMVLLARIF